MRPLRRVAQARRPGRSPSLRFEAPFGERVTVSERTGQTCLAVPTSCSLERGWPSSSMAIFGMGTTGLLESKGLFAGTTLNTGLRRSKPTSLGMPSGLSSFASADGKLFGCGNLISSAISRALFGG